MSVCTAAWVQGGVGAIPELMAEGIVEHGGRIEYKANVKQILLEGEGENARATGVRLADGRVYRCDDGSPSGASCQGLSPCVVRLGGM